MKTISLSDITMDESDIQQVVEVLKTKWLSMGPVTQNFEKEFSVEGLSAGTYFINISGENCKGVSKIIKY